MHFFANLFYLLLFMLTHIPSYAYAIGGTGPLERRQGKLQNNQSIFIDQTGLDENLGGKIDLALPFVDESGKTVPLASFFKSKRPVFMALMYYDCPTLCGLHLNSMLDTFKKFSMQIGSDFEVVFVSIDPRESFKLAKEKKQAALKKLGDKASRASIHFLTGKEASIHSLAKSLGFKYAWDNQLEQWVHPAVSYVLTPEGTISFYHYGVRLKEKALRLSLVDASKNIIGTVMDRLVLFCVQYDPTKKTYGFYAYNLMRVGAFLIAALLGIFLVRFWRKERFE